jgi:hypothetical protein
MRQQPRPQALGKPDNRLAYRLTFVLIPQFKRRHITRLEEATQASEQLIGDLTASNTVEKSTNKINGYDALYVKVKGG